MITFLDLDRNQNVSFSVSCDNYTFFPSCSLVPEKRSRVALWFATETFACDRSNWCHSKGKRAGVRSCLVVFSPSWDCPRSHSEECGWGATAVRTPLFLHLPCYQQQNLMRKTTWHTFGPALLSPLLCISVATPLGPNHSALEKR